MVASTSNPVVPISDGERSRRAAMATRLLLPLGVAAPVGAILRGRAKRQAALAAPRRPVAPMRRLIWISLLGAAPLVAGRPAQCQSDSTRPPWRAWASAGTGVTSTAGS